MGQGVPNHAINTGLKDDEFRLVVFDQSFNPGPSAKKIVVITVRRQRDVQFSTSRNSLAFLVGCAASWVEITAVLVYIRDGEVRVLFECIVDTVTMVGIDINVCEAENSKSASKCLDYDSTIIEYAETGSAIPPGMMKSSNWNKRAMPVMFHDSIDRT
tara:strand:- start:51 stop:524 length:474 start_codon:yes stop_codon:yes gene_type:complete